MARRKRTPPSVYRPVVAAVPADDVEATTPAEEIAILWRSLGDDHSTLLERNLTALSQRIESAELPALLRRIMSGDADRPPWLKHALTLRRHLAQLEKARKEGRIDDAIVWAMEIGIALERWDVDRTLPRAVDAYKRSRRKPTVTDAQIETVVAQHARRTDQAAALGIGTRQLSDRIKEIEKRKSVRPPTLK